MAGKTEIFFIITPGFPSNEKDTTCLPFLQSFVKTYAEATSPAALIVVTIFYPRRMRSYDWNGVRVVPLGGRRYRRILRPLLWLNAVRRIRKMAKGHICRGILSLWYHDAALIGMRLSRKLDVRHYTWILGQDARGDNPFLKVRRPVPGQLIAISPAVATELDRNYGLHAGHVVPIGIDPQEFLPTQSMKQYDIIGVGSLSPLKQYSVFIEVVSRLKATFPGIKALLVGSGPEEQALLRQIADSGLEDNLVLTGPLTYRNTLRLMGESRILLHPSEYEGYGQVILEALHTGCHVVSFVNGEGRVIPHWHVAGDMDEMVEICARLLQQPHDAGPVTLYTIDETVERIRKFYDAGGKAAR